MEKVTVMSKGDIITAESGRKYFTLTDETGRKLICFVPNLHGHLPVADEAEVEIQQGKQEGDIPRLTNVYKDGKPVITLEAKATGRAYGKSDRELLQQVRLAEAQNRSIQAQTALNRAVDLTLAIITATDSKEISGHQTTSAIKERSKEFYQLLQSLTQISEAEVIHRETKTSKVIKEAPGDKEVPKDKTGQLPVAQVQKGQRFTEELRLAINKVGFTKEGVTRFIHEMFGIDPTDKSPGMLINELNDAQFKVFEQEIESRKGG